MSVCVCVCVCTATYNAFNQQAGLSSMTLQPITPQPVTHSPIRAQPIRTPPTSIKDLLKPQRHTYRGRGNRGSRNQGGRPEGATRWKNETFNDSESDKYREGERQWQSSSSRSRSERLPTQPDAPGVLESKLTPEGVKIVLKEGNIQDASVSVSFSFKGKLWDFSTWALFFLSFCVQIFTKCSVLTQYYTDFDF